jgi:hypothetical protein
VFMTYENFSLARFLPRRSCGRHLIGMLNGFASAVAITVMLAGCSNPLITRSSPETLVVTKEADIPPMVGETVKGDDGKYTLRFNLPAATQPTRSLVNFDPTKPINVENLGVNWYQLITVDADAPDQILASSTGVSGGSLNVSVSPEKTYHILILHGHKEAPEDETSIPVLLGNGYIKYKIVEGDNIVLLRMVPVLIDVEFKTGSTLWALSVSEKIAWAKSGNFNVTISMLSRLGGQDGGSAPHGNALWPLRLAEARKDSDVWAAFETGESPQYNKSDSSAWTGSYWSYDGTGMSKVPDMVSLIAPEAETTTGFLAQYKSTGATPTTPLTSQAGSDSNADTEAKTNGTLNYSFTSLDSSTTDYGTFSFSLTYIPFGIAAEADWADAGCAPTQWRIGADFYLAYRLYAKEDGTGASDDGIPFGISWASASKDLQELIDLASEVGTTTAPEEVWVKTGTYVPANANGFNLKDGVALYGGLNGDDMAALGTRPERSSSTLSGDLGTPGDNSDNAYHVVVITGGSPVMDGFIIKDGNASGTGNNANGGGLLISNSATPELSNLNITGNKAAGNGGGVSNNGSSPTLANIIIASNEAGNGGGISTSGGSPILINVVLAGNKAENGGGIYSDGGTPKLINVTIADNFAGNGGGVYSASPSSLTANNSIVWGNDATSKPNVYTSSATAATWKYSLLQGSKGSGSSWDGSFGTNGGSNKDSSKQEFEALSPSPASAAGPATTLGDYNVIDTAVNTGNNGLYSLSPKSAPTTDVAGNTRIKSGTIDMGAYESNLTTVGAGTSADAEGTYEDPGTGTGGSGTGAEGTYEDPSTGTGGSGTGAEGTYEDPGTGTGGSGTGEGGTGTGGSGTGEGGTGTGEGGTSGGGAGGAYG